MNYTYSEEQVKKFKPLIVFHNKDTVSQDETSQLQVDDENQKNLIEQHRLKTIDMMKYNALFWEDRGYSQPDIHQHSLPDNEPHVYSHRLSTDKSINDASMDLDGPYEHQSRKRRYSHNLIIPPSTSPKGTLEPQTQTSIPPPLYHRRRDNSFSPTAPASRIEPILVSEFQNDPSYIRNASFGNESTIGTTFITEPQFHHIYKPQLNRKRRRGNLPKKVTEFLKQWLILHKKHPYPTEREKQKLADETGLMVSQISNWFINARRRILQPLLESESQQAASSSSQNNVSISHSLFNTPDDADRILASIDDSVDVKQDSDDYHYDSYRYQEMTGESSNSNRSLQMELPETTSSEDKNKGKTDVPPPWVLLPAKLPSMNILEKDLEAFKPEK